MELLAQGIKKLAWVSALWLKTIKIIIKIENKLTFMVFVLNFVRPLSHDVFVKTLGCLETFLFCEVVCMSLGYGFKLTLIADFVHSTCIATERYF